MMFLVSSLLLDAQESRWSVTADKVYLFIYIYLFILLQFNGLTQ